MAKEQSKKRLDLFKYCLKNQNDHFKEIYENNSNNLNIFTEPYEITFKEKFDREASTYQSTTTLLLIACLKDNLSIVRTLVNECKSSLETLTNSKEHEETDYLTFKKTLNNSSNQSNFNFKAAVLWHACRSSDLQIIKFLVESGANVNANTETLFNSTPLMVSCCLSKLEVIKYLIEEAKCDVNTCDINGESCIFYAVRAKFDSRTDHNIIKYLIKNGADINKQNNLGQTILEIAALMKGIDCVEMLIENGAKVLTDNHGVSLLTRIAIEGDTEMYRLIFESADVTQEERINSLEIIGVTLANGCSDRNEMSSLPNINFCVIYWEISLDKRANNLVKKSRSIRTCANFTSEFQTYNDLEIISRDLIEYKMQSLWIIERTLSKNRLSVKLPALSQIAVFNLYSYFFEPEHMFNDYDVSEEFFECYENYFKNLKKMTEVWLFGITLQVEYLPPMNKSTLRNFIGLLSFIKLAQIDGLFDSNHDENREILAELLCNILKLISMIVNDNATFTDKKLFKFRTPGDPTTSTIKQQENSESNQKCLLRIFVYVVRFAAQFIGNNMSRSMSFSSEKTLEIKYLVKVLMARINRNKSMAVSVCKNAFRNNLLRRINSIPSEFVYEDIITVESVELFLESGMDPNCYADKNFRQTCLNTLIFTREVRSKKLCDELIRVLLEHGAHMDFTTSINNLSMVDKYKLKYKCGIANELTMPLQRLSLQCLSARAIRIGKVNYESYLTKEMVNFVKMH